MHKSDNPELRHIASNIKVHDRISRRYDAKHGDIFNDLEQQRLHAALGHAFELIRPNSGSCTALDFGCGSGNLTRHLLGYGINVVAADVSERFLALVKACFPDAGLSTHLLNGADLRELNSNNFDLVATYSVLHHVPDYLRAVKEMARVCKSGGLIYLDHEPCEGYWRRDPVYDEFKSAASRFDWRKYLDWDNYVGKVRRWFDPRYSNEGDIHVWPDDHVEWPRVESVLVDAGCEVVLKQDYLLFKGIYRREVYERYKDHCSDMRLLVVRKR